MAKSELRQSKIQNQKSKIEILSRDDADRALQRIGALERNIEAEEQAASERIDEIRKELVSDTAHQRAVLEQNLKALKAWTKKNEKNWVGRTLQLVFGKVWIKKGPPKIVLDLEEQTVVERLRARKMLTCIRVKEEVDKEALENYSDDIIQAVGCARRDGKDKFYYECKKEEVK